MCQGPEAGGVLSLPTDEEPRKRAGEEVLSDLIGIMNLHK